MVVTVVFPERGRVPKTGSRDSRIVPQVPRLPATRKQAGEQRSVRCAERDSCDKVKGAATG